MKQNAGVQKINKKKEIMQSEEKRKITPKCNKQNVSNLWENIKACSIIRVRLPVVKGAGQKDTGQKH